MSIASVAFEAVMAVILIAAAVMCLRVERKLARLRTNQDGMIAAAAELTAAITRAEALVPALRAAAGAEARETSPAPLTRNGSERNLLNPAVLAQLEELTK